MKTIQQTAEALLNRPLRILILILLLLLCIVTNAQSRIPAGFEKLEESPANGKAMLDIVYDFDNDGQKDYVTIVTETGSELRHHLLIYLSATNRFITKKLICTDEDCYTHTTKTEKQYTQIQLFFGRDRRLRAGYFAKVR